MKTPKFTTEALLNIDETGIDWATDLQALTEPGYLPADLLEYCLEGADEDRVQGWRDYVDALVGCL